MASAKRSPSPGSRTPPAGPTPPTTRRSGPVTSTAMAQPISAPGATLAWSAGPIVKVLSLRSPAPRGATRTVGRRANTSRRSGSATPTATTRPTSAAAPSKAGSARSRRERPSWTATRATRSPTRRAGPRPCSTRPSSSRRRSASPPPKSATRRTTTATASSTRTTSASCLQPRPRRAARARLDARDPQALVAARRRRRAAPRGRPRAAGDRARRPGRRWRRAKKARPAAATSPRERPRPARRRRALGCCSSASLGYACVVVRR